MGGVAAAAEAFWRLAEAEPDLGAPSQERFSFLADFSSFAFAGAGVLRSCSRYLKMREKQSMPWGNSHKRVVAWVAEV